MRFYTPPYDELLIISFVQPAAPSVATNRLFKRFAVCLSKKHHMDRPQVLCDNNKVRCNLQQTAGLCTRVGGKHAEPSTFSAATKVVRYYSRRFVDEGQDTDY